MAGARALKFGHQDFLWPRFAEAVSAGNPAWEVPAYNGTRFVSEGKVSKLGPRITALSLPDRDFARVLATLLLGRTAKDTEGAAAPPPPTGTTDVSHFHPPLTRAPQE